MDADRQPKSYVGTYNADTWDEVVQINVYIAQTVIIIIIITTVVGYDGYDNKIQ